SKVSSSSSAGDRASATASRFFFLMLPCPAEHVRQCVVAFVARVFVQVFRRRSPRILAAPRAIPGRRILDGELIEQISVSQVRDPLDHVKVFGRTLKLRFIGEVRRVDDEYVPFPMTDRVAHPLAYRSG